MQCVIYYQALIQHIIYYNHILCPWNVVSLCFNGWFFDFSQALVPTAIPHPTLSRMAAGSDLKFSSCRTELWPCSTCRHLWGTSAKLSHLILINEMLILPMQKLHQLILGFCSFRWFMSLIYFFIFIYVFLFNIPVNTGLAKAIQTQRTPLKAALIGTLYFHCWSSMCCLKVKDFSFHHAEASGLLLEYFPGPKWEAKLSQIHS